MSSRKKDVGDLQGRHNSESDRSLEEFRSKPVRQQIKLLAKAFKLDPKQALQNAEYLPRMESFVPLPARKWTQWFAITTADILARKHFPKIQDPEEKYHRAARFIHEELVKHWRGSVTNNCEDPIWQQSLHKHTEWALEYLMKEQQSEILIVAVQLGMYHQNRSVSEVREVFEVGHDEFGLDIVSGGSILSVHADLEIWQEHSHMDFPGNEVVLPRGGPVYAPFCEISGNGNLVFDVSDIKCHDDRYRPASFFLPPKQRGRR